MAQLPPLNSLKSFECAARTGSYVAAAAELNVTPAAISQQVRTLEAFLKRKLFTRYNNRITLTDAGQAYFAAVTPSLDDIATVTARVMSGSSLPRLVVSVVPSLAECWFMPVMADLAKNSPGLRIHLRVEDDPVDFTGGKVNLRLCYGATHYPEHVTEPLFRDVVLPLCAPARAKDFALARADDSHFIHTHWGQSYASNPAWPDWLKHHMPARRVDMRHGYHAGSSLLALDFARRGLGIALGQKALAAEFLESGQLIELHPGSLPLGQEYCAVYPASHARRPEHREIMALLRVHALR